jgi:hypothetical protein
MGHPFPFFSGAISANYAAFLEQIRAIAWNEVFTLTATWVQSIPPSCLLLPRHQQQQMVSEGVVHSYNGDALVHLLTKYMSK